MIFYIECDYHFFFPNIYNSPKVNIDMQNNAIVSIGFIKNFTAEELDCPQKTYSSQYSS